EIDARGRDFHNDLIGLGLGSWNVDECKGFGSAGFLNLYRFHCDSLSNWILAISIRSCARQVYSIRNSSVAPSCYAHFWRRSGNSAFYFLKIFLEGGFFIIIAMRRQEATSSSCWLKHL